MSPPIPTTISRSSLTLRECPPELAADLAYSRQDIAFEVGHWKCTTVKVSYAHYEPWTRVCRTYPNALHLVQKKAEQLGLELRIIDQRIRPQLDLGLLDRGEVPTVCFRALEAVARTQSSGLIVTPTGADKTSILCGLICLLPMHHKVLVTTEEKPVVNLIHKVLTKVLRGETIGIHNKPVSNPARIIVTDMEALKDFTQGELAYSGYALREFDTWICDEVHRLPEPSRVRLLNQFRTVFSWGLTATPERADNSHQLNRVIFGPTLFQMGEEEQF
jgi:Type III restriction enzyme, res subunit